MRLLEPIDNKAALQAFFERRRALNAYALGDLDEPHWGRTEWFALKDGDDIEEVALLYHGMRPPILIALANNSTEGMAQLLGFLREQLPARVYAHLGPSLRRVLETRFAFEEHGPHQVMELVEPDNVRMADSQGVERLGKADLGKMRTLYDASYPGHWFNEAMLDNGPYLGLRDERGRLASAAGVHVYSERYKVAALGNIVTRPDLRGRGYGKRVTAALCQELLTRVETIGLNVHTGNQAAIGVYEGLGFRGIAEYAEFMLGEVT